MTSSTPVRLLLVVSLATSCMAYSQGNDGRDERDRKEPPRRGQQQNHRQDDRRQPDRRDAREEVNGRSEYQAYDRGAGPAHEFHRGERLPTEYRNRQYVVDNWREHDLRAPPRGYHWVQTGNDYVLAAVATGVILDLFLNH